MQTPRDSNLTRASLPRAPRCGPTDFATRGLRTREMRPSLDGYLVEAAFAFARACATTFGIRAERVSGRFADVTHSMNSLRWEKENASNPERSFAAESARARSAGAATLRGHASGSRATSACPPTTRLAASRTSLRAGR